MIFYKIGSAATRALALLGFSILLTCSPLLAPPALAAISSVINETGKITVSVDGLGTINATGTIRVRKPAGATVRKAYLAAASRGFSGRVLVDGDVKLNDSDVTFSLSTPSTIGSSNHFADVTAIVKPVVDAAPAGIVTLTVTEVDSSGIDGEILAVIFDDPNQSTNNTVILLFGAQNILGDTFSVLLGSPITDTTLPIDMSLGISFGFQGSDQSSLVEVNGTRLSTSAGGQDDGESVNGALLTVGGIDDTNDNPTDPQSGPNGDFRQDDELYDLRPFVTQGTTTISVFTSNPSNDDNIFLGVLALKGATAIVGEGVVLAPPDAINPVNTPHTVTATLQDSNGDPIEGRSVTFTITAGPNIGLSATVLTDAAGQASFTYTSTVPGTDTIEASFVSNQDETVTSNAVSKTWNLVEPPGNVPLTDFRDVRRPTQINVGPDLCGTGHASINFTGSAGAAGDTWITVYDPLPNPPPVTFGSVHLSTDVQVKKFDNSKGAGLLALYNEAVGKKGLGLLVIDNGNTDALQLVTVDQAGKRTVLKSVALGNRIHECVWYRLTMDVIVGATDVTVTGQVFQHASATDPNSALGPQVIPTLTFTGARPVGVDATGEVGIVAAATGAVVDSSVTNFSQPQ